MDGNLAMAYHIENETEEQNSFLADVYLLMEQGFSKEEAERQLLETTYKNLK